MFVVLLSPTRPFTQPPFTVPHLGLHAAAATGNIGLAKYAISHGQPVNSVIDGVLPLHAACSGGSDMVVRLLIENGADVNAPRSVSLYLQDFSTCVFLHSSGRAVGSPPHHAFATSCPFLRFSAPPYIPFPSHIVNGALALIHVYCL